MDFSLQYQWQSLSLAQQWLDKVCSGKNKGWNVGYEAIGPDGEEMWCVLEFACFEWYNEQTESVNI